MGECKHLETQFMKVICSNGAIQVREICKACGVNVRGAGGRCGGFNVPHREVPNLGVLPILSDNRPEADQQKHAS